MKILLVSSQSAISGANKSMCVLAEHLQLYGCDVTIALRKHGDIINEIEARNLKYIVLKNYAWTVPLNRNNINKTNIGKYCGNILAKQKIKRYLKKEKFDIVHNNSISSFLIAKCAEELKIPTIWHFREFLEEDHHLTFFKLYNPEKIINKGVAGIAISKSILSKYSVKYKLPIHMIYNGIEYADFWCEREILQNDPIILAVIGRVCEGKNQFEIVKALSLLHNKGIKNIELHIIGNKEEHSDYYKSIISYLNGTGACIKDRVYFDGVISDIERKYREIDVVVVPSVAEAFGRVAVEAMYSGCYVIGANTAGTSEVLDERYSTKYELGNIAELGRVLESIIDNRKEYRIKAKESQKYAINTFSAERNAELIYELYKNLLSDCENQK